jgi:hypothetical protein
MTFLGPQSDRAVRSAVDAYLDGRLRPEVDGEAVFETRNSRYRLIDGTLFSASDATLVGSELVGWLTETADQSLVGAWWRPGARAVLVDRKHGRHIVVTSATRLLKVDTAGSTRGSPSPLGGSHPVQGGFAPAPYANPHEPMPQAPPAQAPSAIPPLPTIPSFGYPASPPQYSQPPIAVREASSDYPRTRPAEPVHPPPRRVAAPMPVVAARPLPLPAPPPRPAPPPVAMPAALPRYPNSPSMLSYPPIAEANVAEISAAEISSFEIIGPAGDEEELPRFADADWNASFDGAETPAPSEDSFPTMQRRVVRPRREPPPPGPLAQPRGRAVPPAPPSERQPY